MMDLRISETKILTISQVINLNPFETLSSPNLVWTLITRDPMT